MIWKCPFEKYANEMFNGVECDWKLSKNCKQIPWKKHNQCVSVRIQWVCVQQQTHGTLVRRMRMWKRMTEIKRHSMSTQIQWAIANKRAWQECKKNITGPCVFETHGTHLLSIFEQIYNRIVKIL